MLLLVMKILLMLGAGAVAAFLSAPAAFAQATSVKRITRKVAPPPSVSATSSVSKATAPQQPQTSAVWYATVPRQKTRAETEEARKKAIEFQKKRAEEGSATAQYDLGMRYLNGDGVERSAEMAKKWIDLAAKQDHTQAKQQLELLNKSTR